MQGERQPVVDRVELYLRSLLPDGYNQQQDATLDRVAALVEDGVVAEREVRLCGDQVPASVTATRTAVGEQIVTRLAAFQEWAKRNDCTLAPAMELRVVEDSLADVNYQAVRPPSLLLAEYRGGALCCVTPHREGDTVRTVEDRLAELAAGEPTRFESLRRLPLPHSSPAGTEPSDTETDGADSPERALLPQR